VFDFTIEYKPGQLNPADAPSRRPDYYSLSDKTKDGVGILPTLQRKLGVGEWANRLCSGDPSTIEINSKHSEHSKQSYVPRILVMQATEGENAVEPPGSGLRELIQRL
jgi:hypothetical protein